MAVTAAMCVVVLAGCGSSATAPPPISSRTSPSVEATAIPLDHPQDVLKAEARTVTGVSPCGTDRPQTAPTDIVLTCADANEALNNITWRYWSTDQALGTARYSINDCNPDCANGTDRSIPTTIVLGSPVWRGGYQQFTQLTYIFASQGAAQDALDATCTGNNCSTGDQPAAISSTWPLVTYSGTS